MCAPRVPERGRISAYDSPVTSFRLVPALTCALLLAACSTAAPEAPAGPVTLLDKQQTTVLGQPLAYPTATPAQVSSAIITLLPGQETGPHLHEAPLYAYVLSGTVTVEYDGGVVKEFPAGTALMEAQNTRHNGRNLGSDTVRILVVNMGAEGVANTVKL